MGDPETGGPSTTCNQGPSNGCPAPTQTPCPVPPMCPPTYSCQYSTSTRPATATCGPTGGAVTVRTASCRSSCGSDAALANCGPQCQSTQSVQPLPCCEFFKCEVEPETPCSVTCGNGIITMPKKCLRTCGTESGYVTGGCGGTPCVTESKPCTICPSPYSAPPMLDLPPGWRFGTVPPTMAPVTYAP